MRQVSVIRRWSDVVSMRPCCNNSSSRWRSYSSSRCSRSDAHRFIIDVIILVCRCSTDVLRRQTTFRVDDVVGPCLPSSLRMGTEFAAANAELAFTLSGEFDSRAAAAATSVCWRSSSSRRWYSRISASIKLPLDLAARIMNCGDLLPGSVCVEVIAIGQHCHKDLQQVAFDVDSERINIESGFRLIQIILNGNDTILKGWTLFNTTLHNV